MNVSPCTSADKYLVFLGNLDFRWTKLELEGMLKRLGDVGSVRMARDGQTSQPLGYAFVTMRGEREARQFVKKVQETTIGDRQVVARAIF